MLRVQTKASPPIVSDYKTVGGGIVGKQRNVDEVGRLIVDQAEGFGRLVQAVTNGINTFGRNSGRDDISHHWVVWID